MIPISIKKQRFGLPAMLFYIHERSFWRVVKNHPDFHERIYLAVGVVLVRKGGQLGNPVPVSTDPERTANRSVGAVFSGEGSQLLHN